MSDFAHRVADLSPEKRELLLQRLNKQREGRNLHSPIRPQSRGGQHFALSVAQQRLWVLDQLTPGNPAYIIPLVLRLRGRLNVSMLEQSLNEIIRRHEALRTTFNIAEGQPVQVIAQTLQIVLTRRNLRGHATSERESNVQRQIGREIQRPFDLTQGPLMRATLLQLDEEEHVLLLSMHHIVSDGWSMGVILRELASLYSAYSVFPRSLLPDLPIQYADFAIWQRQWLQGEVLEEQLAYWKRQLEGAPPLLQLPADRPRPAVQTFQGASLSFTLSKALTDDLKILSQRENVTLFMTLLAAFQTLLCRYTGQDDIVVGTPIANRTHSQIEPLVGFFANTLVLRTDLSGNPPFRELLRRVKEVALGAYAHQDLPFEKLVEELQPKRNLSYNPLFQILFSLQNTFIEKVELIGLTLNLQEAESRTAKFDLTLDLTETEQGLGGYLEYSTDLFDATTIERMAGHFQTMLDGVVTNHGQCIEGLPMLSEPERRQLLVEWTNTRADYPTEQCIHQLFEAQVERTPEVVAVVFEGQRLTYRELNQRANQLAHYLQALGVGPESLVGIYVERSLEMVIAVLGVLKVGGAYVPLDSHYPKERLAFMLQDSRVRVVLTQDRLREVVSEQAMQVICVNTEWESIAQRGRHNPQHKGTSRNLAYVIYTSGSTGKPKGVAIEHRSTVAFLYWIREAFSPQELAGVLASTSLCFDLSIFELFGPLSWGGTVVLAENLLHLPQIKAWATITLVNTVPSVLKEALHLEKLPASVGTVNLAGEPVPHTLVQQLYEQHTIQRVLNLYGPTEDTTYSTLSVISRSVRVPLTIGRPISNAQAYVLDEHLQPAPIGVPGILYLGGAGLARGYLHRPHLTAEKFIPHLFSDEPGARLYKTGDAVRFRADGTLEFLGRRDQQIKLRGFRIELEEIETVLNEHPQVQECVVVVHEDTPGEKYLAAYLVPQLQEQQAVLSIRDLRQYAQERLADYMVPGAFAVLEQMPLTANGKIDRNGLPPPRQARSNQEETFVAPRDTLELQLARMWEELLGIRPVGVRDNFFELGGHSLQAVQLMAQIQHFFGKTLPLTTLLQGEGSIEQLAGILRRQITLESYSPLVKIQPGNARLPFFAVHPIGGSVIAYIDLAHYIGAGQPFYGLQAAGLYGEQEPYPRVEDMAALYIRAIRSTQPEGPYLLGGWSIGGIIALEIAQQLQAQGQKIALLALLDTLSSPEASSTDIDDATCLLIRFGEILSLSPDYVRSLGTEEQLDYILEKARSHTFFPHFKLPYARHIIKVQKSNTRALLTYKPTAYPGKITLLRNNSWFEDQELESDLGWGRLAERGVEVHQIPGDHFNLLRSPHIETVAECLKTCILKAQAEYA